MAARRNAPKVSVQKPIIGVILQHELIPTYFGTMRQVALLSESYFNFIIEYGCIPFFITSLIQKEDLNTIIDKIDGLLLTGGRDIAASTYNTEQKIGKKFHRPAQLAPDIKRDLLEITLYKLAKAKGIPILGICRGIQLINVAEGGTLYQEIDQTTIVHNITAEGLIPYHEIMIMEETQCHKMLQTDKYFVSSIHHQAIHKLATELLAGAKAEDGIIELIEYKDKRKFIIGIQGHPEINRKNMHRFNNIFLSFIAHAKNY